MEDKLAESWQKADLVSPAPIDIKKEGISVKFSGSSRYTRKFYFDTDNKKYRYFDRGGVDDPKKAKDLTLGEYEITSKTLPGSIPWDKEFADIKYRLCMKLKQRPAGPIFIYDNNLDYLLAVKGFCSFIKSTGSGGGELNKKSEQILNIIAYERSAFCWNTINNIFDRAITPSMKLCRRISNIRQGQDMLHSQRDILLKSWASSISKRSKKHYPYSTIKTKTYLKKYFRDGKPREDHIIDATGLINEYCKERLKVKYGIFNPAIEERTNRKVNGMPVSFVYNPSEAIIPYLLDEKYIPEEDKSYTRFDFPNKELNEPDSLVKFDPTEPKIKTTSAEEGNGDKIFGDFHIKDISSVVLNDIPPNEGNNLKKWVRINGRKICSPEKIGKILNHL